MIGGGIQGRAASYEHYASTGFLWSWNFAISRRWKVRRLILMGNRIKLNGILLVISHSFIADIEYQYHSSVSHK